jgi:hypothetical protein
VRGGYKFSKIIILHNDARIHQVFSASLKGFNIPFFSYGRDSNDNSVRLFIESDTKTILMPMDASTQATRFYFTLHSQLLVTFGLMHEQKNYILNRIRTYGDENTVFSNFFRARISIEEIFANLPADRFPMAMLVEAAALFHGDNDDDGDDDDDVDDQ